MKDPIVNGGEVASVIQSNLKIKGTLTFSKNLFFNGEIEGDLISVGDLTIGEEARVNGNIKAGNVTVWGKITGNMVVENLCQVESSSSIQGDLTARRLRIVEGAVIDGFIKTMPATDQPPVGEEVVSENETKDGEKNQEDLVLQK